MRLTITSRRRRSNGRLPKINQKLEAIMDTPLQYRDLWHHFEVCFFDLDGCLHFGDTPAERAKELLRLIRSRGRRVGFITNNSRLNAAEIALKLRAMGLEADSCDIVTATEAAATYVAETFGRVSVKVAGSASLRQALLQLGHRVLEWDDPAVAEAIVVGRDTEFTYGRLEEIANQSRRGARVVATNPDASHPGADGAIVPESGSLVAAIESAAGVKVEAIGKPHPYLFQLAMKRSRAQPPECMMVGDNLHTDIAGAAQAGMMSVWIRHAAAAGVGDIARPAQAGGSATPTWTVSALSELYAALERASSGYRARR